MRKSVVSLLYICLVLVLCTACRQDSSSTNSTASLPVLGDIHFSPFSDPDLFYSLRSSSPEAWSDIFENSATKKPNSWGQATNYFLFQKLLNSLNNKTENCPLLILQGDLLSHGFKEKFFELYGNEDEAALRSFVQKTLKFIALELRNAVAGDIPVVFVLGNNDSYAGDYKIIPQGQFLEDTTMLFYNTFLLEKPSFSAFSSTYQAGGYYKYEPFSASDLTLICLNTVMFSKHWTAPEDENDQNAPEKQLDWLQETLISAQKADKKAWLLTHIPTGVSAYGTIDSYMDKQGHISDASMMWKSKYQARFLDIISEYGENLEAVFAGHTHMDEYRIIKSVESKNKELIFITPAVSPLFGNNPAFKIFSFSATNFTFKDYQTLAYPLTNSSQTFEPFYRFSNYFDLNSNLNQALITLYSEMPLNDKLRTRYINNYYSGHNEANNINSTNWPIYRCTIGYADKEDFISCVN